MSDQAVARGAVATLLEALVDDAAIFPPGNAPMDVAVAGHAGHRSAPYSPLVGPFLCAAGRVPELRRALDHETPGSEGLAVALVARGLDGLGSAVEAVTGDARLRLAGIEVAPAYPPGGEEDAVATGALEAVAALAPGVPLVVEVPRGPGCDRVLDVLARAAGAGPGRPARAKLRTGGLEAAAFPTEGEVATFVHGCARRGLAFKCTAGLHHAVRHTAPGSGFEHHGYLNILLASRAAARGTAPGGLVAVLAERDAERVADGVLSLDHAGAAAARALFTAFGACSIGEPVADAVALGLLLPSGAPIPDA